MIPQEFLDELLNRVDLVELIDGYVPLKKRGNSFIACCPFHTEKSPSFNVVARKQFYHCFGCGASGNAISFVMTYLNQGFTDAVETLASRQGMTVPSDNKPEKTQQSQSLYQLLAEVSQFYQQTLKHQGEAAINYLRGRGVSGTIAKQFQLGFAPSGWNVLENRFKKHKADLIKTGMLIEKDDGKTYDRYRQRIMFPIHDRNGRIIGFGGRAIESSQQPKYLNSPETIIFQKNRELYGLHHILHSKTTFNHILIVEGYMDVIALAQHGITNAVAALGTATSTYHIQLLSKHTKQLIFCFDGDNAGKKAAWRALENSLPHLENGLDARFAFLPDAHDPDSLVRAEGKEAFCKRLSLALPLSQYFLDTLTADIDTQSVAGKSQLIAAAKPFLQTMPEGSYKQLMIDELARYTRIENHRILQIIKDEATLPTTDNPHKPVSRSPMRLAIALLLQNPSLYGICQQDINIDMLDGKDQDVLRDILKQIQKNPNANTAALIEAWRDTPLFTPLGKLAGWEHHVPEEALAKEFIDTIYFLQKQNLDNKIRQYIEKSRKQGLSDSEKQLLQTMLQQTHQSKSAKK